MKMKWKKKVANQFLAVPFNKCIVNNLEYYNYLEVTWLKFISKVEKQNSCNMCTYNVVLVKKIAVNKVVKQEIHEHSGP